MADTSSQFAVIETGGKQYKVAVGDVITIEKLPGELSAGDKVTFDKVLLVDDGANTKMGAPYIAGSKVTATFQAAGRAKKVRVSRFRHKAGPNANRVYGHRQHFNKVKIESIA